MSGMKAFVVKFMITMSRVSSASYICLQDIRITYLLPLRTLLHLPFLEKFGGTT